MMTILHIENSQLPTALKQIIKTHAETLQMGFPGGTVVKNPRDNAGDMGSSPGPGRSHMPWSN